ncbi:MAG: hypothetical protein H6702_03490 [Myxococcales bacterium]|nr:hypothetical protein [Myxococcales bacterium]
MNFELDDLLTRDPACPSELALRRFAAGALPAAEAAALQAHLDGPCTDCAAFVAAERAGPAGVPGLDPEAAFARILAGVAADEADARLAAQTQAPPAPGLFERLKAWLTPQGLGLVALGAAAAAAAFLLTRPGDPGVIPPTPDGVRMKGDLALEVARKAADGAEAMASGDVFAPDDELRFVVSLPTAGRIAIVGVEADGTLYPAWPLPQHTGAQPDRQAGPKQALTGAVQLDGKPGREVLHLVLCPADVPATCQSNGPDAAPRCPQGCRSTPFVVQKGAP